MLVGVTLIDVRTSSPFKGSTCSATNVMFCVFSVSVMLRGENTYPSFSAKITSSSAFVLNEKVPSADVMSKTYEEVGDPALSAQFLFYTFVAAFVVCLLLMKAKKQRPGLPEVCCWLAWPDGCRFWPSSDCFRDYSISCRFTLWTAGEWSGQF